jgi:hypothetical protein
MDAMAPHPRGHCVHVLGGERRQGVTSGLGERRRRVHNQGRPLLAAGLMLRGGVDFLRSARCALGWIPPRS